jgi:hypothetical protein
MKLESIMKTDNEIDRQKRKAFMMVLIAAVCFVVLYFVAASAQRRYGSCCQGFISAVVVFVIYTVFETIFVILLNDDNKYSGVPEINARNNWFLTLCRMAFMIAFLVLLPTTGTCDGEKKEWALVVLISIASLFAIAEGLHMIGRSMWYCVRLLVNLKRNAVAPNNV